MADKPEAENNEHTLEELITGIGKLVYKLNESVLNIDTRLEKLEAGISTLLKEQFEGVKAELVKSNELLTVLGESNRTAAAGAEETAESVSGGSADVKSDGLIEKLDELKTEVTGIREDLSGAEEKFVKALADGPEDTIDKELFKKELGDVSQLISESSASIQNTIREVVDKSDESRGTVLSENLKVLSDGISEISSKMAEAGDSIQEKIEKIQTSTADEIGAISKSVKESTDAQNEQLQQMKDLLSLHSVEVQDNRVRDLNRRAIVHFNNAEYTLALSKLKEALDLTPESSELLANMAHIEASQGHLDKAEEYFKKALEINPDLEPAVSGLGTVMVMNGRIEDSITFLQKHLAESSEVSNDILIALSRAFAAQDNHAKALALLEQAEKTSPGHPGLERELAKYRD